MCAMFKFFKRGEPSTELKREFFTAIQTGNVQQVKALLKKNSKLASMRQSLQDFMPLCYAARRGDLEVVRLLLAAGADANAIEAKNFTALQQAANRGQAAVVELLLNEGAEIDVRTPEGFTALHQATFNDHANAVRVLLAHGANIEARDSWGSTPLLHAAIRDCVRAMDVLLGERAEVDARGTDGRTSLHQAADLGHARVAELLLARGADANTRVAEDLTSLHLAASKGHENVVRVLLAHGADINVRDKKGVTPLFQAAVNGHSHVAEVLIENGADLNARSFKEGFTSLDIAAANGREKVVRVLLAHGANVNTQNNFGATPLIMAAMKGHSEVVDLLLNNGADIHAQMQGGLTALMTAEQSHFPKVAEMLRKHMDTLARANEPKPTPIITTKPVFSGAVPWKKTPIFVAVANDNVELLKTLLKRDPGLANARTPGRSTPLIHAVAHKNAKIEVTCVLLAHGADVNAQQNGGATPLYMAASWGNLEVVKLLLAHGADINIPTKSEYTPLHEAAQGGKVEIVELLLANGAEVNAQTWSGDTALQLVLICQLRALRSGSVLPPQVALDASHKKTAELLLANGIDVNNVNCAGSTALHMAAGGHFVEIVKLLIEKGADVNAREIVDDKHKGETPLHLAVAFDSVKFCLSEYDTLEIVKLLIEKGADVNAGTSEGFTPLQLAEQNHYIKVAEVLRKNGGTLGEPIKPKGEPVKSVQGPPNTMRHEIGIAESPEVWAERLKARRDYRALAAINNSQDYSPAFKKFKKRDLANRILREAGVDAVDAIMEELDTEGVGSVDLANLLVSIGDLKAVPLLKKKLDRGLFDSWGSKSTIKWFVEKHQDLVGEVEIVTCALCGRTRPVTETQLIYEDGKVKRFCKDTCWGKRGRVLKSGIGTDCPFYSEGICTAGNGDSLCSLKVGSYESSCHVYAMFKGAAKRP
jgi:ankyrin repeat protein